MPEMNRDRALDLLDRLHTAQNAFYSGGPEAPLRRLLTADITWTVPGQNDIAGSYRGLDEVFAYFRRRRELASQTFRMTRRDVLVGEGNRIAALTDGEAVIGGVGQRWSTVGLYEILGEQIAACWLLPLDQVAFDRIWSGRPGSG
jgi:ketosteroid isomerase-like protein